MTRRVLPLLGLSLVLTACASSGAESDLTLDQRLENPLYAEQYYDNLVDHLANLIIVQDPVTLNDATKRLIDEKRLEGLRNAQEATGAQAGGLIGSFMSENDNARGEVLLKGSTLYMAPSFETAPGIDLHMYLSNVLDPRDGMFPDDSAIDLGAPASAFGAHSYAVNLTGSGAAPRSLVLFDKALNRIYGFAQLQTRN